MVLSRVPKRMLPFAGQALLRWVTASVILTVLFEVQLTIALRAADTPAATPGCSYQPPVGPDARALSACPDAAQTVEQLERRMWELINREREHLPHVTGTRGGAKPLKWDEKLAEVARAHSRDMLERAYVSHYSPDGSSPALRVSQAGITYLSAAENIAKFRDVFGAEAAFMDEPPLGHNHRANILDPDFTHVGIGIVRGPDGMFYITQEFAQRP